MRDTSIEPGKERTQMSVLTPGIEPQESPFPKDIDRSVLARFAKFTPEARAYFVDKLRAFAEQLIINSGASAEENGLDTVSAKNVELALSKFHPAPRSRSRRFASLLGGILLGAGISALVSMLIARQVTEVGSILAFILSIVGTFLIAFD
jgi:histone H3/H4